MRIGGSRNIVWHMTRHRGVSDEEGVVHGPTGSSIAGGVEGLIISGHEDQFIRFYDANSGK